MVQLVLCEAVPYEIFENVRDRRLIVGDVLQYSYENYLISLSEYSVWSDNWEKYSKNRENGVDRVQYFKIITSCTVTCDFLEYPANICYHLYTNVQQLPVLKHFKGRRTEIICTIGLSLSRFLSNECTVIVL